MPSQSQSGVKLREDEKQTEAEKENFPYFYVNEKRNNNISYFRAKVAKITPDQIVESLREIEIDLCFNTSIEKYIKDVQHYVAQTCLPMYMYDVKPEKRFIPKEHFTDSSLTFMWNNGPIKKTEEQWDNEAIKWSDTEYELSLIHI